MPFVLSVSYEIFKILNVPLNFIIQTKFFPVLKKSRCPSVCGEQKGNRKFFTQLPNGDTRVTKGPAEKLTW